MRSFSGLSIPSVWKSCKFKNPVFIRCCSWDRRSKKQDVDTISKPDFDTDTNSDIDTVSKPDFNTISKPDFDTDTNSDNDTVSKPDFNTISNPDVDTST
ncbi:hypothetical protein scyTo_0019129 [Scyliorhinus torazame]|uniref:Uncharacterized protein n=1 Tax=Scyliorhinus torazame TaxID=75743 RepID=A0A401PTE3_SCYTO|nr:hypothetical protein [Scyliorhinus torazame]